MTKGKFCLDKKWYLDKHEAERMALIYYKRFNKKHRVYECPLCDMFHTTTVSEKTFKRKQNQEISAEVCEEVKYWENKLLDKQHEQKKQ